MDILCDESLKISILPSLKVISEERVNNDANFLEGYKLAPHHINVNVCLGSSISSSLFKMSMSIIVSPATVFVWLRNVARRDKNYCTCLNLANSADFKAYFATVLIDFLLLKSWKDLLTIRSVALSPVSVNSGFIL